MIKAVFLDRDGVLCDVVMRKQFQSETLLNEEYVGSARTLDEIKIRLGTKVACQRLVEAGFKLFCITNQPDLSRGIITDDMVRRQDAKINRIIPLTHTIVCRHTAEDNCSCRKPKPGMIYKLAYDYDIDLSQSYLIGDRNSDLLAGNAAKMKNENLILLPSDREKYLKLVRSINIPTSDGCICVFNIKYAVDYILKKELHERSLSVSDSPEGLGR